MQFQDLLLILESKTGHLPKRSDSGFSSRCPAHDDKNPSLSISDSQGKILLNCFSGCSIENICASLDIEVSDLFAKPVEEQKTKRTVYSYTDETGKELYRKIRIEPGFNGQTKSFYSELTDDNGTIVKSLGSCRKVLYRLPELLQAISENTPVFLVEGEKDVENLRAYNLQATNALDSLKWTDEFTEVLKEADVIILYDKDQTGLKRKDNLCKNLYKRVKRLRVVDLPGLEYQESHGADISDWLSMGHTTAELMDLVSKTPDYTPPNPKGKVTSVNLTAFLNMELPKAEMLLSPILPKQGIVLIYAKPGVGKTHVALGIAYAIATGGAFLKWSAPTPKKVLYIDGEMPGNAMQERLRRISVSTDLKLPTEDYLTLITQDLQNGPMPDLSTKEGRDSIEEHIEKSDLIIIDNISTLFRTGVENEAESWQPIQNWALDLRRRGKSILFVHHAGKGGQQRGTSKKEDVLDTIILLKRPENYRSDQGAQFVVEFDKTRHFAGDDAQSFQVQLREADDGLWHWDIIEASIDNETTTVADLLNSHHTIDAIVKKTGLTKSQVETRKKKAKAQNLLD